MALTDASQTPLARLQSGNQATATLGGNTTLNQQTNPRSTRPASSGGCDSPSMLEMKEELRLLEASQEPLNITLGLEIEFLLAHCTSEPQSSGGGDVFGALGMNIVWQALHTPVVVRCATCNTKHNVRLPVEALPANEVSDFPASHFPAPGFPGWIVDSDMSLKSDSESDHLGAASRHVDMYDIEVKSPVLRVNSLRPTTASRDTPEHTHCITYQEEVRAVLARLAELPTLHSFEEADGRFYPFVNESCGIHVHVGNAHHGFPLQTVKNILTTHILNERLIDALHTTDRIGGSDLPTKAHDEPIIYHSYHNLGTYPLYTYNLPYSTWHHVSVHKRLYNRHVSPNHQRCEFNCAHFLRPYEPHEERYPGLQLPHDRALRYAAIQPTAAAHTVIVQNAPTVWALRGLSHCWGKISTINLDNLEPFTASPAPANNKTMTIEFRQHAGSLDPVAVLAWMSFLTSNVQHAHKASPDAFLQACANAKQPSYTLHNLFDELDCEPSTREHYQHKSVPGPSGLCYADEMARDQLNAIAKMGAETEVERKMAKTLQMVTKKQQELHNPQRVRAKIHKKLTAGGYGLLTDDVLDHLFPDGPANALTALAAAAAAATAAANNEDDDDDKISRAALPRIPTVSKALSEPRLPEGASTAPWHELNLAGPPPEGEKAREESPPIEFE
ncbi:hypothetical protein B0A50_01352 [Salinomyces thailandicus]|uniref:Uncharacterized protein n=1 Tax=Salinomyces thailandicus TaxID=706561 RepID=A0A4U0UCR9_9PEZI|nr:hypothetical protein B0A50_01352 [Salinomyces thailandica]